MQKVLELIQNLELPAGRPALVAISGFGGSGKTTLAQQLKDKLGDAEVISIDDFVSDELCERSEDWTGFDRERFRQQVLEPARNGESIRYDIYDFGQRQFTERRSVRDTRFLLLEGCSIFHPDLMPYYDLSVWIDCPLEIATERGIKRDRAQAPHQDELWHTAHEALWRTVWMPNEQDFFTKYQPACLADYVYRGEDAGQLNGCRA